MSFHLGIVSGPKTEGSSYSKVGEGSLTVVALLSTPTHIHVDIHISPLPSFSTCVTHQASALCSWKMPSLSIFGSLYTYTIAEWYQADLGGRYGKLSARLAPDVHVSSVVYYVCICALYIVYFIFLSLSCFHSSPSSVHWFIHVNMFSSLSISFLVLFLFSIRCFYALSPFLFLPYLPSQAFLSEYFRFFRLGYRLYCIL